MSSIQRIARLTPRNCVFLLCDVQEKFRERISCMSNVIHLSKQLLKTSQVLQIPTVVTEQYPKGLGHTCGELDIDHCRVIEKTRFSMCTEELKAYLSKINMDADDSRRAIVLFGIEAHVCVMQTALDLREKGFDVHLIADATSSQQPSDRFYAFERKQKMRQAGVWVSTFESVLYELLRDAKHPKFKELSSVRMFERMENGLTRKESKI